MTKPSAAPINERLLLFLIGAVQFVNILDFMLVAPLGPALTRGIGMPESQLADAVAAYTAAAAVSGLIGAFFLDRFDRRPALALCMVGLVLGTAAGGLATSFETLLLARMLAGAFGGPATSIAIAIISDVVPPERRGKAMGAVMGAFAAASVLGVPLSLILAELGSWRTPFLGVAAMGLILSLSAAFLLPPLRLHLAAPSEDADASVPVGRATLRMLSRPAVIASYTMTFSVNMGGFILLPNIATFVQNNLGLPAHQLKYMYLAGGLVSFLTTRVAGRLVDRMGTVPIGTVGSLTQVVVTYVGFANVTLLPLEHYLVPSMYAVFMSFMFANGVRNVAYSTLTSQVPGPRERARFMSIQSAVQHFSAAAGATLSARILGVTADHRLTHFSTVASVSIAFALALPFLLRWVDRRLRAEQPLPVLDRVPLEN